MESTSKLAIPIYQKLSRKYSNLTERREATKQYILNEITQWSIKSLEQDEGYFYKPVEFKETKDSKPFQIWLTNEGDKTYELKFGDLNTPTDEEKFKWDDNDPYKLQKALFLVKVLENKVIPLFKNDKIEKIKFTPYDGDGLGEDRLSYFYNMFSKLNKNNEFDY